MAVTLATFGIALLLAGILGGGITIGKVTIPPIPTRRKRIVVWSLGAVLLVAGLYHDRFFTSDSSPDDVIPGGADNTPAVRHHHARRAVGPFGPHGRL